MFFDGLENIESLAKKSGFSIFVLPNSPELSTASQTANSTSSALPGQSNKNHFIVTPDSSNKITIDQIREIIEKCQVRQKSDYFIYVYHAEAMNEKAENAFLKLLEEPAENYHFALFVNSPSSLLPTILSRGDLYIKRIKNPLKQPVEAEEAIKKYAKRIISARKSDLPSLASEILADKMAKKNPRTLVLQILDAAIEILYKSFFVTKNPVLLQKLPKLLLSYDNLKQNGHVKLHLVADLC